MKDSLQRMLIWGAGGHGRVVRDVVQSLGGAVVAFVDRGTPPMDDPVLPETAIDPAGNAPLPLGATALALGIGDNRNRWEVYCRGRALRWPQLVHPSTIVGASVELRDGTVVMPRVVINAGTVVGQAVILNTGAIIEHDCIIGDGAHISPNATLCGGVKVGHLAWVGAGAIVIPGVAIGDRAIVGAGAVVTRDVPPDTTVVGSPARPVSPSA